MVGYVDQEAGEVVVERAIPLTRGEATDVQLEPRHYAQIAEIQDQLDAEGGGRFMVGWFHSHPGLTLFYSYIDLLNQLAFQVANPDFVGLVFDHTYLEREGGHTGFEIYKITDVTIDIDDPRFETNYHQVPYRIEGLNEYFFANVLTELSARSAADAPLELSYEESVGGVVPKSASGERPLPLKPPPGGDAGTTRAPVPVTRGGTAGRTPIPLGNGGPAARTPPAPVQSDLGATTSTPQVSPAERKLLEARKANGSGDHFTAIDLYQRAVEAFAEEADEQAYLEALKEFAEATFASDHLSFAEQAASKLVEEAERHGSTFHLASGHVIAGQIRLKQVKVEVAGQRSATPEEHEKRLGKIQEGLEELQQAALLFERAGDWAGVGWCNEQIGVIQYYTLRDYFSAALFYVEALKAFKKAETGVHPLRKSAWAKPEQLRRKVRSLRLFLDQLLETRLEDAADAKKERIREALRGT
ncbi:MAG: hypothetical protein Kow0069_28580 [Promethearchaeota archaeon]